MNLREYMKKIRDSGFDDGIAKLNYNSNDKDCGYRSGLRYLQLSQSADTDEIAEEMIYGVKHKKSEKIVKHWQMELFA